MGAGKQGSGAPVTRSLNSMLPDLRWGTIGEVRDISENMPERPSYVRRRGNSRPERSRPRGDGGVMEG